MGAPKRYPPPLRQLGELMLAARRRGEPFDEFWTRAVRPTQRIVLVTDPDPPDGVVLWPTDAKARKDEREAICGTREGWRRAYERLPQTRPEKAVELLGDVLGDDFEGLSPDDLAAA